MGVQPSRCGRCGQDFAADALFCPMCGAPRARLDGDPLIGQVIADRYLLRERLGHGGSGSIYLGEHVTLRRRVAVKILHDELCRDDLAVERFRREATTVGEIDNEHIVEVHDFGRTPDGRLFLAMELLEGETLADAIARDGRLPIPKVVDVLTQVGEALMEAHAMGYIHRDLRPRNVFLSRRRGREGFVKLLDFGLAKLVEREGEAASTSLGMTFGDPHYMSPEQAQGSAFDRRADIYAMGVIAYEMLLGAPPFTGKKVFDVLTAHLEQDPPPPSQRRPEVPAWLDAIVLRMLAKRPDDRFVTVYRLVEALREGQTTGRIMSDDVARSHPTEPPPPPAPRASRETAIVRRLSSGEVRAPAGEDGAGMSGAWFADGDSIADEGSRPGMRTEPVRAARGGDSSAWAQEAYEDADRKKRLLIAGGSVGAVLVVVLAIALWPRGGGREGTTAAAATATGVDAGARRAAAPDAGPRTDVSPAASPSPSPSPSAPAGKPPKTRPRDDDPPPVLGARSRPDAGGGGGDGDGDGASATADAAQAEFYVKLGRQALARGDVVTAAANFYKAREFDPSNAQAIAGLGEVALQQGHYQEAVVHLERASKLAPRSSRIHTLLGQAYLMVDRPRPAAAAFKKALQVDPNNDAARRGYQEAASQGGE